ncbi:MAG: GNAT family N-acetyltransferase [Eubacteriales bacterium]|nr:GNAT family N-acetyltransferase [Eubacteriales bacterium]
MIVRKAELHELDDIMKIYAHARKIMKENGNPHQWGDQWPDRQQIEEDIAEGGCYLVMEAEAIAGVFFMGLDPEPTYERIEAGAWLNDEPYAVLHRVAAAVGAKQVLKTAVDFAAQFRPQLRIDTHADNHKMQYLLEKYGFRHCGTIFVEDQTPRLAYQRCANL